MSWKPAQFAIAVVIMMSVPLHGEDANIQADSEAYCQYVSQQAMAQRDLLRTPNAVSGITQPNEALPMQFVWGVSASLSDMKKAGLTMDVAQKNCALYKASTSTQQDIQYALPNLEKQALKHRLELIDQAEERLDSLTANTARMLEVQNVTRPMLFSLQTARIKLDADRADTQSKIAALYVPDLSEMPLTQQVAQKEASEAAQQQAVDKLARQSNWDVALSFGARQQVNPIDSRGLYGAVSISYNLGSHAINKHLDQAASAYDDWKKVQQNDVSRGAQILKQQVKDGIATQESRLKSLQDEEKQIEDNLQVVSKVGTAAALDFRNQLTSTQLLLKVETGDASFRLQQLQDFLEKNF